MSEKRQSWEKDQNIVIDDLFLQDNFKGQTSKKEYMRFAKYKCLSVEYLVMLLKIKYKYKIKI